ncbi:TPA: hypothetical protein ACGEYK_002955 [Raoultella ornithinolytica]
MLQGWSEPTAFFFGDELLHCVQSDCLRGPPTGFNLSGSHLRLQLSLHAFSQNVLEFQLIGTGEEYAPMCIIDQHQPHRIQAQQVTPAAVDRHEIRNEKGAELTCRSILL